MVWKKHFFFQTLLTLPHGCLGITDATAEEIALKLGLENRLEETKSVVKNLYKAFVENDASMIEINPYAEDTYGKSELLLIKYNNTRDVYLYIYWVFAYMG